MSMETISPPAVYVEIPYVHSPPAIHDYGAVAMSNDSTITGQIILIRPGELTKSDDHGNLITYVKAVVYLTPEYTKSISFVGDEIPSFEYHRNNSILPANYLTNQIKDTKNLSQMKSRLIDVRDNINRIIHSLE